ncbi:MAG: hypothetical protein ACRD6X_08710 [Pyrinomonadaceae bacterium]
MRIVGGKRLAAKNPLPDLDCSALTYVRACAMERGHSCPQADLRLFFARRCAYRPYLRAGLCKRCVALRE